MIDQERYYLTNLMQQLLPLACQVMAINYARNQTTTYWLIKIGLSPHSFAWVTLRLGDHFSWLLDARQLQVRVLPKWHQLEKQLEAQLQTPNLIMYSYQLSKFQLAILKQSLALSQAGLIWFLRMPETMAQAHKKRSYSLARNFRKLPLYLGWRNNFHRLLLPFDCPRFLSSLLDLFGKNFWFGQFSSQQMLKLLPTRQWIEPVLKQEQPLCWQKEIAKNLGSDFLKMTVQTMKRVIYL